MISSYLYIVYAQRIVSNVIINGALREQLSGKIKPWAGLANGSHAAGLTIREYQTIAALTRFPPLPPAASNIEYRYQSDGFLPDYSLQLIYDVPSETPVVTYDRSNGRYSNSQSVDSLTLKDENDVTIKITCPEIFLIWDRSLSLNPGFSLTKMINILPNGKLQF